MFSTKIEASLLDRIKITENRLEFDQKNWHWNLTKTSQQQTFTGEYEQNLDEFHRKYIDKKSLRRRTWMGEYDRKYLFQSYTPFHVCRCSYLISHIFFRSYTPICVCRCGNIYYIFGQVHHVNVCCFQLFGHSHWFRS